MTRPIEIRPGSVLDDALQTLHNAANYPSAELRHALKLVNRVVGLDEAARLFADSLYIEPNPQTRKLQLAPAAELRGTPTENWLAFAAAATEKFVQTGMALKCERGLGSWQVPSAGVLLEPTALARKLQTCEIPSRRMACMAQQPLAKVLGLAAVKHYGHDNPYDSYARADDILQVHAVQKSFTQLKPPFTATNGQCTISSTSYELQCLDTETAAVRMSQCVGEYTRPIRLINDTAKQRCVALQTVHLVRASMFAVSPELTDMLLELEATPDSMSHVDLHKKDSVEVFADAGAEAMPLATTLRATQQWQLVEPQLRE